MRHLPISSELFVSNRKRLAAMLPPGSMAILNANDVLPTNADGSLMLVPNSDLFYLSGIGQEESVLLLFPDAFEEAHREVLFLRQTSAELAIWEGHKHTKEEAKELSGIATVKWLSELPRMLRALMCDANKVFLNTNEHKRAACEVETRDDRFAKKLRAEYPLHQYDRLAKLLHTLRLPKSNIELDLLREAVAITDRGFKRVCKMTRPGVMEHEIEAEFAHEFIKSRAKFAYTPIIAAGKNACVLHYISNDQPCKDGDVLLLDVAASYANYNADLTRTIPVNGKFTPRQRAVYDAVLRVLQGSVAGATVGKLHRDWQRESQEMMNEELLKLGLITKEQIAKETKDEMACRKYFMHGLGHPLGLDVHDVGNMSERFGPGWVLTVEPGIYIPEEGFGVRLENDIIVTEKGPVDLMADTPIEAEAIEDLMASK